MLRGDIHFVSFEPVRGSEGNKRRPAVVVSNDHVNRTAANLGRGVVTVVPIKSNIRAIYPFQVLLSAEETALSLPTNLRCGLRCADGGGVDAEICSWSGDRG